MIKLHPKPLGGIVFTVPVAAPTKADQHPTTPREEPRSGGRQFGALSTIAELTQLMVQNGRWWLLPMIAIMLMTAVLLVVVQAIEYVAPFIYTVF